MKIRALIIISHTALVFPSSFFHLFPNAALPQFSFDCVSAVTHVKCSTQWKRRRQGAKLVGVSALFGWRTADKITC